ncbi:MAG: hypothetical protein KGL54_08680 [Sphingomonadales bacterium]|nr:hypothetical protein [Sphingomonadales bacterium]
MAALAAALAIAGCSAGGGGKAPTAAADPLHRQAGSWKMLHYATAFEGENLTGGMVDMAAAAKASVGKKEFAGPLCLSAEAAAKDDLTARLNEAIRVGPEWKVVRSTIKDGQVDFAATMDDPHQGKGELTITGMLSPTTTDLLVTTDAHEPAPGKGHIHTVTKQENTRAGDCPPGQDPWS